jgi:hypothetical protein
MKKILLFSLFSLFFVSPILGASLDYNKSSLKISVCAVENNDLKELSGLSKIENQDNFTQKEITKILTKIKNNENLCRQKINQARDLDLVFPILSTKETDACVALGLLNESKSHYLNFLDFSSEELKKKGYENKKELEDLLSLIENEIKQNQVYCNNKQTLPKLLPSFLETTPEIILHYYKNQTYHAIKQAVNIPAFIKSFREIEVRSNILIKELLIHENEFETGDILKITPVLIFHPEKIYFYNYFYAGDEEKIFNFNFPVENLQLIKNKEKTALFFEKTEIQLKTDIIVEENTFFYKNTELNPALKNFLDQNKTDKNLFELYGEDETVYLTGTKLKKEKILGILPVKIPVWQKYFLSKKEFILQKQNKPWWSLFCF